MGLALRNRVDPQTVVARVKACIYICMYSIYIYIYKRLAQGFSSTVKGLGIAGLRNWSSGYSSTGLKSGCSNLREISNRILPCFLACLAGGISTDP